MADRQVGLWLIGAFGGVGSTVALGAAALKNGLMARTGLVTDLDVFRALNLDDPADFVLGGHDIRTSDFASGAAAVGRGVPAFSIQLIDSKEQLVSLSKSNLREYGFFKTSPMPSYKDKLNGQELADVVSYLLSLKGQTP